MIDFDKILDDLTAKHSQKRDIALAKAKAETNAVMREHEAYWWITCNKGQNNWCEYRQQRRRPNSPQKGILY